MFGCDPPLALLSSALQAAKKINPNPNFLLFGGDFAQHDEPSTAIALQSIREVVAEFSSHFPGIPVQELALAKCLGNSDISPEYHIDQTSRVMAKIAQAWTPKGAPAPSVTELSGGYRATEVVPGLVVLSLNTVLYSLKHTPDVSGESDPWGQFAWLESQLSLAIDRGQKVWILGHVPPAVASYSLLPKSAAASSA
jgi:hypothetical protein